MKNTIIFLLLLFSLVTVNFGLPRGLLYYFENTFSSYKYSSDSLFENDLRDNIFHIIESEAWVKHPYAGNVTLSEKIRHKVSVFEYGEFGLLMYFSLLYAQNNGDEELKELVKLKFDEKFVKDDFLIERCDQVAYGNVAVELFQMYGDNAYKNVAKTIYRFVLDNTSQDNIMLYRNQSEEQHVDAIGLVVPFLVKYSKIFGDYDAAIIAKNMVLDYCRYGTDYITGIPVQTYNVKTHVKLNHSNWGRGISWFLMGAQDVDDSEVSSHIDLLDSVLLSNKTLLYNHFFSQGNEIDMSATIPVWYHLKKNGRLNMSKTEYIRMLSPFFDSDGYLGYCSKSISFPHDPVLKTTTSLWCSGIALYLLSIME